METSNKIVEYARQCLGTKFVHQGRQPSVGLDCAGLVIHIAKCLGVEHNDIKSYPRLPYRGMLQAHMDAQPCLNSVSKYKYQAGDILLMRFTRAPQHLGIYTGDNYMIHTYDDVGRVVEHRLDTNWHRRITGVYRFIDG